MNLIRKTLAAALLATIAASPAMARTITFAGQKWTVRPDGVGGPRDNTWCDKNVWVDADGALHLRLSHDKGQWCSAEITSKERMGFGTYQWQLKSRVDLLDQNIVFGLFHYPTPDLGSDGTNEIDIEFSKWGKPEAGGLNYTVYPEQAGLKETTTARPIALDGDWSTHRYVWSPKSIRFESTHGHYDDNSKPIADWTYAPQDEGRIAQKPMPVHLNLWQIAPPSDGQPVEVVISGFTYRPLR